MIFFNLSERQQDAKFEVFALGYQTLSPFSVDVLWSANSTRRVLRFDLLNLEAYFFLLNLYFYPDTTRNTSHLWEVHTDMVTRSLHSVGINRPIWLTQCCTQFKSLGVKVLCVLHLHDNVAFAFKWYWNTWNKKFYSQSIWIGYNIELA